MRFFPYKEIYVRTSLTKVEAHKVIREYSVEKIRLNIPYIAIRKSAISTRRYLANVVNVYFEGYVEEVRGQTALYGTIELMAAVKGLFILPFGFTALILSLASLPWYTVAGGTLAVIGLSYLWVRFLVRDYAPYFTKRFSEIFRSAEKDKEELGEIDYENISL